jgi:hypothetical protein
MIENCLVEEVSRRKVGNSRSLKINKNQDGSLQVSPQHQLKKP